MPQLSALQIVYAQLIRKVGKLAYVDLLWHTNQPGRGNLLTRLCSLKGYTLLKKQECEAMTCLTLILAKSLLFGSTFLTGDLICRSSPVEVGSVHLIPNPEHLNVTDHGSARCLAQTTVHA
jgi:hypothetical protein